MYPTHGEGQDVPKGMLDYFFPEAPRPGLPYDELLTFDVRPLRAALHGGTVDEITVRPLPKHHYPIRRSYFFRESERPAELTEAKQKKLQKMARRGRLCGFLEKIENGMLLMISSEDEQTVEEFAAAVSRALSHSLPESEPWHGPVTMGFRMPQLLPEEDPAGL